MISVFVLVLAVAFMVVLYRKMHRLKTVSIVPNFSDTELKPDEDYSFIIKSEPFNADIKSLVYNVDDPSATFKATEPHRAVLHTGNAGTLTIYVSLGSIESEKISYTVTDNSESGDGFLYTEPVDEPEEEMPVEEPAAEEGVQPEEPQVRIFTVNGDNVRMRAEPNTDCEVVKTCNKGETYTFIEVTGEWTGVDNNGKECYIKSEFLDEVIQEQPEAAGNSEAGAAQTDNAQADAGQQDNTQADAEQPGAQTPAAEPDKKIGEGMVEVLCKDGKAMFTQAEYDWFVATWSYTGMADEMMTHHTAEELHKLYKNTH